MEVCYMYMGVEFCPRHTFEAYIKLKISKNSGDCNVKLVQLGGNWSLKKYVSENKMWWIVNNRV